MTDLPIPPGWRAVVKDTIERLEAQNTLFAHLALPGWYAERATIEQTTEEIENGNDQTLLRRHHSHT